MRLIPKTIIYLLLVSIPVLITAGIFAYRSIYEAVEENTRELLLLDKSRAEQVIESRSITGRLYLNYDSLSYIDPDTSGRQGYQFGQALNMFAKDEEQSRYNTLKGYYKKDGQNYLITIWRPAIEEDDLIESLIITVLLILLSMMLVFFIASIFISRFTWQPFYKTLGSIRDFKLQDKRAIPSFRSTIKEFSELNDAVAALSEKMIKDYQSQKEFTENASHEMQTPLAVLKAKIESLMQSPRLNQKDLSELAGAERAINKLITLNKSLLLLAKIENHQFNEVENIDINKLLEKVLRDFEDYIAEKQISVETKADDEITVLANKTLMEILLSNFIQNAIRHNISGGLIKITLQDGYMKISNSGSELPLQKEQLFKRFKHNNTSSDSLGLGLSIIQSISDLYSLKVDYSFENRLHVFTVRFQG